jgi:hypothetical protein
MQKLSLVTIVNGKVALIKAFKRLTQDELIQSLTPDEQIQAASEALAIASVTCNNRHLTGITNQAYELHRKLFLSYLKLFLADREVSSSDDWAIKNDCLRRICQMSAARHPAVESLLEETVKLAA